MKKHSVRIGGHRTSYSLEPEFQDELQLIATGNGEPLARLIARVDAERDPAINLSSALRLLVLETLRREARGNEPARSGDGTA